MSAAGIRRPFGRRTWAPLSRRTRTPFRRRPWATVLAAAALSPLLMAGTPAEPFAGAARYQAVLTQTDPGGVVTAVTIRYPVGSAQDPQGEEGTAFLLGQVLQAEAAARLAEVGGFVEVEVARSEFLVTFLAPPERWADAFRTVQGLLAPGESLSTSLVERLREIHRDRLGFEEGAPVREFELERARLLLGVSHPGARRITGTAASLERITAEAPARFRDTHFRQGQAVVAVVGPVEPAEVESVVGGPTTAVPGAPPFRRPEAPPTPAPRPMDPDADTVAVVPAEPLPPAPLVRLQATPPRPLTVPSGAGAGMAWSAGDRTVVDRNLTSAWMAMVWPFPRGTSRTLLEFLARSLEEAIVTTPPGPGHFASAARIEMLEGGPVLVFDATVDPRMANTWENRIVEAMPAMAEAPPTGSFFELGRRRYRSSRLMDVASPENRSRWLVRRLAEEGEVPDVQSEIWRLTEDGLAGTAAAAGPPRILIVGPRTMMERSR